MPRAPDMYGERRVHASVGAKTMKRFVICADGTWNDPERRNEKTSRIYPTNVLKVARMACAHKKWGHFGAQKKLSDAMAKDRKQFEQESAERAPLRKVMGNVELLELRLK